MIPAPRPDYDDFRLADLLAYDILDTPAEKDFDELVELAAFICDCPVATITFVDRDRQWFKARKGMPEQENSRDTSLCAHTILNNEMMVVEDTFGDERFRDYPEVCGGLGIRFYAGVPIVSAAGFRIGSFCVIDQQPRRLTQEQLEALWVLSRQVTRLLELRLRHRLTEQRAGNLLFRHKELVRHTLQEQEQERQSLGAELHENVGQVLASALQLLQLADQDRQLQPLVLPKVKEQIQKAIQLVRDLSRQVAPYPLDQVEVAPELSEFQARRAADYPFPITITCAGMQYLHRERATAVVRILEHFLLIASFGDGTRGADIKVTVGEIIEMELLLAHTANLPANTQEHRWYSFSGRVEFYGGSVSIRQQEQALQFDIRLPAAP